ncbi:hypothetical protein QGN29_02335 [Temperatibacter marinus]|uniref:Sulfotransferase n=1 Tax=Temperatibacter marinus TaxID=1456591 RepID=A0AA52EI43_9PROT|nr:hypothetical protein [Temperatibacter marinus]WND03205.1 hypothetical protein QGN29_02335 [Temperatibacter marinus]
MIKYAHIGLPKGASSWLQNVFFPSHPEIAHLGRGPRKYALNEAIKVFLWHDALSTPEYCFDSVATRKTFDEAFSQVSENKDVKAAGVSQELFTNIFFERLDIPQRAQRLKAAMGDDVQIIFILRNQFDFIKSHYDTSVWQLGYTNSFEEHLHHFYYDRDIGAYANLYYDKIFETYADIFGQENVHAIPFELIKQGAVHFSNTICESLGISHFPDVKKESVNAKNTDEVRAAMLLFNRRWRYSMGGGTYNRAIATHQTSWYKEKFDIEVPDRQLQNQKFHHFMFRSSQEKIVKKAREINPNFTVEKLEIPEFYQEKIAEDIAPHNRKLAEYTKYDLKELGYIL